MVRTQVRFHRQSCIEIDVHRADVRHGGRERLLRDCRPFPAPEREAQEIRHIDHADPRTVFPYCGEFSAQRLLIARYKLNRYALHKGLLFLP